MKESQLIHEIFIPGPGQDHLPIRVVWKNLKDGKWDGQTTCQVSFPVAEFDGLTIDEQHSLIKQKIRETMSDKVRRAAELMPLKQMEGYEFDFEDKGNDPPVKPDPRLEVL